ncbi:MarR family winged helix-turn-helix transcriptional regulator [Elongatibacter sediminis]|uniref:MarR family transcriptional regulator n=1 Tax=Elongatibacter sediminis TaxID=3119006 RepID=A0AAW9R4R3_9GAMM
MTRPYLFDLILDHLPEAAHRRRAWLALLRCFTRIERELMQHFAQEYNSSLPRYDVLTALALSDNGLTMGDLATLLRVSKGNITGVVRRLKEDGLVRKVTSRKDRRVQSVTISPEGRRLWKRMHDDYDRLISELLAGRSDGQVQSLTRALERTLAAVNKPND